VSEPPGDRVQNLFDQAVVLPAEQRAAFLETACAGDPALRAEVESLLACDLDFTEGAGDDGMLKSPIVRAPGPAASEAREPSVTLSPRHPVTLSSSRVGHYRIVRCIAEGGMGAVYEAEQDSPRRTVALKVIRPGLASPALIKRFTHEAQILGRLHHPGIAQVYEAGLADDGQPFFAMEFIRGLPLDEYARQRAPAPPDRLALVARACDAVQHAHDQGVIHRDLKPANILVEESGQPKVLDFGVARATDADLLTGAGLTRTGQLLGTPNYMSPEQVTADPAAIDHRADVYALGVILFELLAHRPPYHLAGRPLAEVARLILEAEPPWLGSVSPELRGDVQTIVAKALAKDPARRYQSAAELAADLRRFLSGEPIVARRLGRTERLVLWVRRRPTQAAACGLAVLLLVVSAGCGTAFWFWREAETARQGAETARREADDARKGEAAAKEQLDRVLDLHRVQLAYREWQDNNVLRARQLLAECAPGRRDWEWAFVDRLTRPLQELHEPQSRPLQGLVWSSDGSRILTFNQAAGVHAWDPATGRDLRATAEEPGPGTATADGNPHPAAATPNGGRIIAHTRPGILTVWEPEGRKVGEIRLAAPPGCLACSPDGRSFAYGCAGPNWRSGQTHVCAPDTGEPVFVLQDGVRPVSAVAYRPDSKWLASGAVDGTVRVWNMEGGKLEKTLPDLAATITSLAFYPDCRRLAAGARDGTIRVWDVPTGKVLFTRNTHGGEIGPVAISPDQRRLAAGMENGTVVVCDEYGKELFTLRAHVGDRPAVTGLAFSPDGRRLASSSLDGSTRIWDATVPQEGSSFELPVPEHTDTSLGLSGGGRWFLMRGAGIQVVIWDRLERRQMAILPGHTSPVAGAACSADGRRVASIGVNGLLRAWELPSRRELIACEGHAHSGEAVAVDPAGALVASGGANPDKGGEVKIWDLTTGEMRFELPGQGQTVNCLAFSPDGRRLASAARHALLRVQDPRSGAVLWAHEGAADFESLEFSPDGAVLACGDRQGTVTVRETETGREVQSLRGHTRQVTGLAFHPDGRRLASGSADNTVRLWDLTSGQEALMLRSGQPLVAFSADGHTLFATGKGSQVRLWRDTAGPEAP
jgi:WD40 repeat protein/predicted Ser/Thr protein kinase